MSGTPAGEMAARSSLERLNQGLLSGYAESAKSPPKRGVRLVIHHPAVKRPDLHELAGEHARLSLELECSRSPAELRWGRLAVARSCSRDLPFHDASMTTVLLYHVVAAGDEPELEEACRVLQPGGRLLILGLNRLGWRYLRQRGSGPLPGIRPLRLRERLEMLDFSVDGLHAAGFLSREWPRQANSVSARLLAPILDCFLITATHSDARAADPPRKARLWAAGVHSAAASR